MKEVRGKFQSILETGVRCLKDDGANIMMDFWRVATSRENLPYLRLLLEVQVLAIQNRRGYRKYLVSTSDSWLEIVASALPPGPKRVAFATLCTAVIDGLLLELLSTGDQDRTFRALKFFTDRFAKRVRGKSGAHR
jgi:hypothetical protein